jgi:hypothetical protein
MNSHARDTFSSNRETPARLWGNQLRRFPQTPSMDFFPLPRKTGNGSSAAALFGSGGLIDE